MLNEVLSPYCRASNKKILSEMDLKSMHFLVSLETQHLQQLPRG